MYTEQTIKTPRLPHPMWQLMIGYLLGVVPNFMLPPLITLSLAQRGVEPTTIGLMASMQAVGLLIALPLTPVVVRWTSERLTLLAATWATLLVLVGLLVTDALAAWAVASGLTGAGAGMRYVIAQSWITAFASPAVRGRIVGLFETLLGVSALAAPGVLLITGVTGNAPLVAAGGLVLVGLLLISPVGSPQAAQPSAREFRGRLVRGHVGTTVLVAAFLGGLFETGMLTALPLFSTTLGFNNTLATLVVTVVGVGSTLQVVFGLLADRFRWRRVLLGAAAVVMVAPLLLLLVSEMPGLIWPLGVVLGAAGGGLYTLAIICVSTTLSGPQLVTGTTSLAFIYVLGSSLGPIIGGLALDLSPLYGMTAVFTGAGVLGFVAINLRARRVV